MARTRTSKTARTRFGPNARNKRLIAIVLRDGGDCNYCGSWDDPEFDHIYPVSLGGRTLIENMQILCITCNVRKGDKVPPGATIDGDNATNASKSFLVDGKRGAPGRTHPLLRRVASKGPRQDAVGYRLRHSRSCLRTLTGGGAECSCIPTYGTSFYDPSVKRKIQRTFSTPEEALSWRAEAYARLGWPSKVAA